MAQGFAPIPLPARSKKVNIEGWSTLRVTEADINEVFAIGGNIGLLTGIASNGLIDVDLDCPEAIRAGAVLLPATGMISGRQSAPRSHYWYRVEDPPARATEPFDDPIPGKSGDRHRLLELRSSGGQTMVPPSVHPKGETCLWHEQGEPAQISIHVLRTAVRGVAAASLLGRYWPKGARHDASLALAGALLRAGWPDELVERFQRTVCAAAEDDEVEDRVQAVRDTTGKLGREDKTTGWPSLARLLGRGGDTVIAKVLEWLGVTRPTSDPAGSAAARRAPIPPYAPFPTALLPAVVRDYVEATARAMNRDPSYSPLPSPAALGSAIRAPHVRSPKDGWKEPPFVWALAISKSGAVRARPTATWRTPRGHQRPPGERYRRARGVRSEREGEAKKEGNGDSGPRPKPRSRRRPSRAT